jgi:hypothetical protein
VSRPELIERINALSDDELARVAPYLEADLEALSDLDDLRAEVARGRASAQSEPLLDDADVVRAVHEHLKPRA